MRLHCRFFRMLDTLHTSSNRLLLALQPKSLQRLRPELETAFCKRDQVLIDTDAALDHVYFPETAVVSLTTEFADGSAVEMATIGREGCTGVQVVLGAKVSPARVLTQMPGRATRMSRRAFAWAMESLPDFKELMYEYAQAFLDQALISGACNAAHRLNQRLARWLLTTRDRSDEDTLPVTQSLLAELLGVQRPTMTSALGGFERAGLIAGARRQITIVDRTGLTEESCECYHRLKERLGFNVPAALAIG
jgi:CRP-like cAMP-binding protein